MAAQGISDKDLKQIETKPLVVIIKYLTITIVAMVGGGVVLYYNEERKIAAADARTADAITKLITSKDENAANLKEFNSAIAALRYYESRDNHNGTTNSGDNPDKKR